MTAFSAPSEPIGHAARAWWDIHTETVDSPDDAEALVYDTLSRVFPHGGHGFTSWWGPLPTDQRDDSPLRVDLDVESGRAAVQWLPTKQTAVEPGVTAHHSPLLVTECTDYPPIQVPADRALVTPGAAIRAIREYIETGQQPTNLSWTGPAATGVGPARSR
ncbi:Imm1 family immunity protein [Actinoplanes sp. NPDC049316]|uniref:Imm1 family immunity protein n=1 Tax=Actinoplanes sp. NPDC049316 TaxID=3154727 RepID=UPI0034127FB4